MNETQSPFAQSWKILATNGYHVIPISPHSKVPSEFKSGKWWPMRDWQRYRQAPATELTCGVWATWPECNIGILTGTNAAPGMVLACIDYDSDDPEAIEALTETLPATSVTKRGRRGFSAFYLVPEGTQGFRNSVAELLTDTRQTVIPPSIHCDTGKPYAWTSQQNLEILNVKDLSELSKEEIENFRSVLNNLGQKPISEHRQTKIITENDSGETIWRRLNNTAYNNLDSWIYGLGLQKLTKTQTGYKAVAHWRASTSGRSIANRNPNLSIMIGQGARDFGDSKSYTALDLVSNALSISTDEAFSWLSERLGLAEKELPLSIEVKQVFEKKEEFTVETVKQIPVHLTDESFDLTRPGGLLEEVIDYIADSSRRPSRMLSLGSAISVLGTLIGGAVEGPTGLGTHLYIVGIAPSGSGKDKPLKMSRALLGAANAGDLIGPDEFMSATAVMTTLKDKPVVCCSIDEIGSFLRRITSSKASAHDRGITKMLRTAWSTNFESMMTSAWASKAAFEIKNPSLTIFGVSTPQEFFSALGADEVSNGFLNRFLIMENTEKVIDVDPKHTDISREFALKLAKFRSTWHKISESEMTDAIGTGKRTKKLAWGDGRAIYNDLLMEVDKWIDQDPEGMDLYRRTGEIALRLAAICAAGHGLLEIDAGSMTWAARLSTHCTKRLRAMAEEYMAENETQKTQNKILRIIGKGTGISHRQLLRALQGGVKSNDLKGIMENLVGAGLVEITKTTPLTGGPLTIHYKYSA